MYIMQGTYFLKTKQLADETTMAYAARLREKALKCDFHGVDERILEHIIKQQLMQI